MTKRRAPAGAPERSGGKKRIAAAPIASDVPPPEIAAPAVAEALHVNVDAGVLQAALAAIEARGARAFDAPSCDCARRLLTRASELEPRAAALLHARAAHHVARLGARFDLARATAEQRLAAAEQCYGALVHAREAHARGDFVGVRHALCRRANRPSYSGLAPDERTRRAEGYHAALSQLAGEFAVARALDVVPDQAGPYNPLRIAGDLLERMRAVSPIYLNAQLARLDELASMLALPELAEPPRKSAPRKLKLGS